MGNPYSCQYSTPYWSSCRPAPVPVFSSSTTTIPVITTTSLVTTPSTFSSSLLTSRTTSQSTVSATSTSSSNSLSSMTSTVTITSTLTASSSSITSSASSSRSSSTISATSSSSSSTVSSSSSTSSATLTATPRPNYPGRIFNPYTDILTYPNIDLVGAQTQIGLNYFTLAFIGANSKNNPAWGGSDLAPVDKKSLYFGSQISAIKANGGDITLSFGGANVIELATIAADAASLAAQYQYCIDAYQAKAIDFDLEGGVVNNVAANDLRSQAVAILRKNNPGIVIGMSLPCTPSGLIASGIAILKSAVTYNTYYDLLNCMAFDFGSYFQPPNGVTPMADFAISAVQAINKQGSQVGLSNFKAGVVVSVGTDDIGGEIFTLDNAKTLFQFAKQNPWIGLVSFWCLNRDNAAASQQNQTLYQFSQVFAPLNA
ncbi:hypothetical protein HDV06_003680 [Boothiomyces sp. JEL0866]|nr:hypothetical protein HDV06_003680 [Boothiomyces sp. JEL0866]